MKHLIYLCAISVMFMSCSIEERKEQQTKSLQELAAQLQRESATYSDAEWDAAAIEFDQIVTEMENYTYSDEELREIGRLKGQCVGYFAKYQLEQYQQEFHNAAQELQGAVDGFLDVFSK